MSQKKLFSVLVILIFFIGSLISQEKELSKEDYRREVLIGEYYLLLRADKKDDAFKFAEKYFPGHLVEKIKKEGHKNLSKEDFNEQKIIPVVVNKISLGPEIKNLAGSGYEKHSQLMKSAITEYNRFLYQGKPDKAMEVVKKYFPQSEIDYIEIHGHSPITGYQVKQEEVQEEKPVYRKVTKVFVNETKLLYNLTYEDGTKIQTTWNHPFSIIGKGWVEAKDLKVGDYSKTVNGKLQLNNIEVQHLDKPVKVYNFEVEGSHTYFVSNAGILVHNYGGEEFLDDLNKKGFKEAGKNLTEATKNKIEGKGFDTNEEIKRNEEKAATEKKRKEFEEKTSDAKLKAMSPKDRYATLREIKGDNPSKQEIDAEVDSIMKEKKYPKEFKSVIKATIQKESESQHFMEGDWNHLKKGDLALNANRNKTTKDITSVDIGYAGPNFLDQKICKIR